LNIFPNANTALHFLYHEEENIKKFYEVARHDKAKGENIGKIAIPFIRNY
jgi:hypothetical protein